MDPLIPKKLAAVKTFVQCLVDGFFPAVAEAMAAIRYRPGLTVYDPPDRPSAIRPPGGSRQQVLL
jgi:hypothetical protein